MKKYLFSFGINYYAEKECLRMQEQARKGWSFVKMNSLGLLSFERKPAEEKQFAVDFYRGDNAPEEIQEYLDIYEASGWEYISSYRKKYFFFKANLDVPKIFSDKASYEDRLKAESKWLFKRSFVVGLIGLLFTGVILAIRYFNTASEVLDFFLGMSLPFALFPIMFLAVTWFMNSRYKNRADSYQSPEAFAKKQRVLTDTLLCIFIGALIGFLIGLLFSIFI